MGAQFQRVYDRLQDVIPEKRIANLVLAMWHFHNCPLNRLSASKPVILK
jgi:hypothetical protein